MVKIGKYLISEKVNGPGKRFVLWFQGCRFHCKGCFNPEFWDEEKGKLINTQNLIDLIFTEYSIEKIEGVTFTGGEPFIQAKNILPLAEGIRSKGLSIVCYTGFTIQEILNGDVPYGKDLLNYVDILIDGKFIEEKKSPLIWRGSQNQKVYFLTDRYKHLEKFVNTDGEKEMEILIGSENIISTGTIDMKIWERLMDEIKKGEKE